MIQSFDKEILYIRPNGDYINLQSMLTNQMEWYFLDAGEEDGTQYYYIVSKAASKYLYFADANSTAANNVSLQTFDSGNADNYKFSIVKEENREAYNIKPKGATSDQTSLNKSAGVSSGNDIKFWNKTNDNNSCWKFVSINEFIRPQVKGGINLSTGENKRYYWIQNYANPTYFIKQGETWTDDGKEKANSEWAITSSSTTDEAKENMKFYFVKAGEDDWQTYYYIIHKETGKYLYYRANGKATGNAVVLTPYVTGEEERFRFIIIDGWYDGAYNIISQYSMYDSNGQTARKNNIASLKYNGDNAHIPSEGSRNEGNGNWKFISTLPTCETPTFEYDENTRQISISCATDGASLYYTTDGTNPTTSSAVYSESEPITITSGMTAIKAIAGKSNYDNSPVATQALATYTYKVVNRSNKVATSYEVKEPVGKPLSRYTSIPAEIRSGYLSDETVTFYSFSGSEAIGDEVSTTTISSHDPITETPSASANIYVTYTTTHLSEKFLPLTNAAPYNVMEGSDYLYGDGTLKTEDSPSDADTKTNAYLWYFMGSDPYNVTIQNLGERNYLNYASSTLSLNTAQTFILKTLTSVDATTVNVTLRNVSGEEVTLKVNTVVLPLSFTLIDKAGKIIESGIDYEGSLALPVAWRSPLVSEYKYYKKYSLLADDVYTFNEGDRITSIDQREGNVIYVTYEADPSFIFDTTDDDAEGSQTYMLKFTGGETFNQENGSDGTMTTAQKAVYPYSNGDAMLYVYGSEQWNTQLASGSSTRTRWLWHVVSPNSDPYHVKIMSQQSQVSSHNYFRTFAVEYGDATHIVTGVTTLNDAASSQPPTEYMVLTTDNGKARLVTVETISDGTTTARRVVNNFEQYWKNNPTVQNLLGDDKVESLESYTDDIILNSTQTAKLPTSWHSYKAFANAAPWVGWKDDNIGTGKQYKEKHHWFQNIDMGTTGEFDFEATTLEPQVILIDQHGWEIMRTPLSSTARLKLYDSPMVKEYQWYPTASKIPGYHKYNVSNPKIPVYVKNASNKWVVTTDSITHTSTTLADDPYSHFVEKGYSEQDNSVKSDFYVTYTVKDEYAKLYSGAATEAGTSASKFLVKQGDYYAEISGSSLSTESTLPETISDELQWYLKPNFNIDEEMGYEYSGENDELTKEETEAQNYSEGRNGFDPYNLQIKSVANENRYFTANTSSSTLTNGYWTGETSSITLQNLSTRQNVIGNDQVSMKITNATFMVVDDGDGNMILMPRFDHTQVIDSLTGTQLVTVGNSTTSLTISLVPTVVTRSSQIHAMGGTYMLGSGFTIDATVGTADAPFEGSIDGQMFTISSSSTPFIAYANNATIKNFIVEQVSVSSGTDDGNVGAIVCEATGNTRIYNVGINGGSVSGTNYVGGLVGLLDGYARVINCYSYADITDGSYVGGIVGYNNYQTTSANLRTMVMNCMYYGNISGGSNKAPIYNGEIISNVSSGNGEDNKGLGNYNYFLAEQPYVQNSQINTYNCALMAEARFLQRFEFFRLLLNSHLELAGVR